MKKMVFGIVGVLAVLAAVTACSSTPKIKRGETRELSGAWSATDVEESCNALIAACLDAPLVREFIDKKGGRPTVIVGVFANDTSEHMDTSIISQKMRTAILNSGRLRFVESGAAREELRGERQDQQSNASEATAAALANETGADLMLKGSVKSMGDRAGNKTARTYYITAQLTNIETTEIIWEADHEIQKVITRSKVKP